MKKILFVFLLFLTGCTLAHVQVDVLSERTSLENQVLGTYNALDREMLLVASVRGVDSTGQIRTPPKHSQEHKDSVNALQVIAFHSDDLQAFKRLGWVGENNQGLLTPFAKESRNAPDDLKNFVTRYSADEFQIVVNQINQARETIMKRVLDMNENLTETDLPEIHRIFAKMNSENASSGEKIQDDYGKWKLK